MDGAAGHPEGPTRASLARRDAGADKRRADLRPSDPRERTAVAGATGTQDPRPGMPAGVTERMALLAHDRGARLLVAARDARTIAWMLDNHGRSESADVLRRSGDRGERLGRYLAQLDETDLRRTAAIAAASAAGLVIATRLKGS